MGIYLRGNVYWARWSEEGQRRRRSLQTSNLTEAQRRYRTLQGRPRIARSAQPGTQLRTKTRPRRAIRMRQVLAEWLKYQTPRAKPQSVKVYNIVRKRFTLVWGNLRPEEITTQLIEEYQERALRVGLHPRTINYQIGFALSAVRWAHERGLIDAPPPKWKRLKLRGDRMQKYLSAPEIERLLKRVEERRFKRLEPAIMLALYAGLRQGEIVWLTWDDVDLDEGWLHVQAKQGWSPKSASSERSIPLTDELARYLARVPRVNRWVAPQNARTKWDPRNLGIQIRRLFSAAKVNDGGRHKLHRLRGTFATQVLRAGGDLESLREILGHSALSVTAGYLTATSESKRRAVQGVRFGERSSCAQIEP